MYDIRSKYSSLPKAVKASLWFTICSVLQKGVSFLTVPIFTRMLSVEEYGMVSLFAAWQSVLSIFATLNLSYQIFNNGMVHFEKDRDGYTTAMLGLSNFATIFLFLIYLSFYTSIETFINLPTEAIVLMFCGFLFSAATSLWTVQQRFLFEYRTLCILTIIGTLATAILGIVFVSFNHTGISKILADMICSIVIGIGIYLILIKKDAKLIDLTYWKYALRLDIPLIPHYLSMIILSNSDRIMIDAICGKSFTALYSVPYNASMVMQIIITSINASFIPWTYQKCKEKSYEQLRKISSILLIFVMCITLIPSLFAPELVWLLGSDKYAESMWVVPPVSCSIFFIFLYSMFSNIELYYGKSKNMMIASLVAAAVNILLNFIVLPHFGYISAAYTTLFCYIFLSITHYAFMKKVCNEKCIREIPYEKKLIILISGFLVVYSMGVTLLFGKSIWIRYSMIALIGILMYRNKDLLRQQFITIKK